MGREKAKVNHCCAAEKLPWTSEEMEEIVETFTFDKEDYADYFGKVDGCRMCVLGLLTCTWPCAPCYYHCAKKNAKEKSEKLFVALTRHEIMYCETQRRSKCRAGCCCDEKEIKIKIPYDKIQDMRMILPHGGLCIEETLTKVEIQTVADGKSNKPELTILGLTSAPYFVDRVRQLTFTGATPRGKRQDRVPEQMQMQIQI